jgi:hypothetical protein
MGSNRRAWRERLTAFRFGAGLVAVLLVTVSAPHAQDRPAAGGSDPRVGLKPGFRDAGQVASYLELVTSLPRPNGFFDPAAPGGAPAPTEPDRPADQNQAPANAANTAAGQAAAAPQTPPRTDLNFANSDLAFSGDRMFVGNFNGFNIYAIENPRKPQLLSSVVCPGGQGDMSVHGHLLFMSVEQTRGRVDCGTKGVEGTASADRLRGIRIFDISDVRRPKQVAAVQTCRGSHTHTLVVDPRDASHVYLYGSGTATVRPGEELEGCSNKDPKDDPDTALFSIDVIEVPLAAPERARIVNRPRIFADPASGAISGLWKGGNHGEGTQTSRATNQCHDITAFPAAGIAAGACAGNGILLDISDPARPARLDQVVDRNFAYWHSATFSNDGSKVIFTDEWGGGTRPRCRAVDSATWGADAVFDVVDRKLRFGGYYKMPAPQTELENCVAHNGSTIPVPGRDLMAQAWYQGGVSVFDFTDSAHPVEIAYFDRGPLDASRLIVGGYWSSYWFNGHIYATEIARGIDVFKLMPSPYLTQNEIDAATLVHSDVFNAQQQPRFSWPDRPVVARAYLDQLTRSGAVTTARAGEVRTAVDRLDRLRSRRDRGAADTVREAERVEAALRNDAAGARGRDADRLRALADLLGRGTARLR